MPRNENFSLNHISQNPYHSIFIFTGTLLIFVWNLRGPICIVCLMVNPILVICSFSLEKNLLSFYLSPFNTFDVVSVDPIENVKASVRSKCKEIVRGNRLCFASFLDQEELRKYGHRLEVDGKRPENLQEREFVVQQQRHQNRRYDQKLNPVKMK